MLTFLLQSNQYRGICIYVRGAETLWYCFKELQWELPPKTEIKQLIRPDWGAVANKICLPYIISIFKNNKNGPWKTVGLTIFKTHNCNPIQSFWILSNPGKRLTMVPGIFVTDHVWTRSAMVWPWCVTMVFYKLLAMVYCQPWLLSKLLFFIKPVKAHNKIFMCLLLYLLW